MADGDGPARRTWNLQKGRNYVDFKRTLSALQKNHESGRDGLDGIRHTCPWNAGEKTDLPTVFEDAGSR